MSEWKERGGARPYPIRCNNRLLILTWTRAVQEAYGKLSLWQWGCICKQLCGAYGNLCEEGDVYEKSKSYTGGVCRRGAVTRGMQGIAQEMINAKVSEFGGQYGRTPSKQSHRPSGCHFLGGRPYSLDRNRFPAHSGAVIATTSV